ncbi:MAG: DUF1634 domain-containing protein [Peptococcaceae bacterium]|nr:DUF1634 domain-containing protein [Peptococcaceae bacterium]
MAETKLNNGQIRVAAGESSTPVKVQVPQEQIKYANLLLYGSWIGIAILTVTFILYITGIKPAYIEPSQIQQYWGMKSSAYLEAAKVPSGWGWLGMVRYGDFLPLIGIAWLGILTVVGYLILLPAYLRKKDSIYSVLVIVEVVVLVLAASGLLGSGGH